jgi:hypothetical protein
MLDRVFAKARELIGDSATKSKQSRRNRHSIAPTKLGRG